jgi:AcrR family transcriptional regulator
VISPIACSSLLVDRGSIGYIDRCSIVKGRIERSSLSQIRRERKAPEERRAQILDAAARLFVEGAVEDVSMAEIAEAAGVAKGLPYHYFESKDELLGALRERYLAEWYALAERRLLDPPSGREWQRLGEFVGAMYEFFDERRDLHRLLLAGENAERDMFAHGRRLLGAFIVESKRRGALEVDGPDAIVEFVLHGLHGLLLRFIHDGRPSTEFVADALRILRRLLRPVESSGEGPGARSLPIS